MPYHYSYHRSTYWMYWHGSLNCRLFLRQDEWLLKRQNSPTLLKNFQRRSLMKFWICWTKDESVRHVKPNWWIRRKEVINFFFFFSNVSIKNRTHSLLLRHLRSLLERHTLPVNILRWLWLNKIQNNVTQILTPWKMPTWRNWQELLISFAKTHAHKTLTQSKSKSSNFL